MGSVSGEQLPFVHDVRSWATPGPGFEDPSSLRCAAFQEQAREVVKAFDARTVGAWTHLGIHVSRQIERVCKQPKAAVAHSAGERDLKELDPSARSCSGGGRRPAAGTHPSRRTLQPR